MNGKLICKILGHDFRKIKEEIINPHPIFGTKQKTIICSEYCRRCGLSKKELGIKWIKKQCLKLGI